MMNSSEYTSLDEFLIRDYLFKLMAEGENTLQQFYGDLVKKSFLFKNLLSKENLPSLREEEAELIFTHIFPTRRKSKRVIEETGIKKIREAISDLLYGEAKSWEEKVENFSRKIRGLKTKSAKDTAADLLHFTFPEDQILWTSWIWDPETETGAVVFLKEEPPTGGKGKLMYGENYNQFSRIYLQLADKLESFGVKAKGFLFVDIFLATIYAIYVDYMTLSTMHSAKGFFPPAISIARRLLGVYTPLNYT